MDYLITGATGFIGQKLVARLLADGNEVTYLGRNRSKTLDSRAAFVDTVPAVDAVVNLAGEPVAQRWNEDVKRRIFESRVNGTRQLVAAMEKLKHKPRVLVSASATGYYGNRGDEILTEASAPGHDFLADVCVHWEREALRAADFGMRVVLIRISPVLGREGGVLAKALPMFRAGTGGNLGSGKQWMPWIHIDDLVELFIKAATNANMAGPFNASVPQPITNAEFTRALAAAVHRPALLPVPKFALRLGLGEAAGALVASQRVVPEATQKTGFTFRYPDLQSALEIVLK